MADDIIKRIEEVFFYIRQRIKEEGMRPSRLIYYKDGYILVEGEWEHEQQESGDEPATLGGEVDTQGDR